MREYAPYEGELPDGMGGAYQCNRCRSIVLSGQLSQHNILHSAVESAKRKLFRSPSWQMS